MSAAHALRPLFRDGKGRVGVQAVWAVLRVHRVEQLKPRPGERTSAESLGELAQTEHLDRLVGPRVGEADPMSELEGQHELGVDQCLRVTRRLTCPSGSTPRASSRLGHLGVHPPPGNTGDAGTRQCDRVPAQLGEQPGGAALGVRGSGDVRRADEEHAKRLLLVLWHAHRLTPPRTSHAAPARWVGLPHEPLP